ncbi:NAD-P-binding protein [Rhodofomes roseus]|uniref:NAD-P-binding protein n=1 Tax=Rhodofomes roseus TaxID=34475 RepID=A0ABQ8KCY4_9APHY|nr:NAD-P-binding protein [Rhodofomes roseus]KAH9835222.1 NAD-P-binding protein [Rhodofomes roseus]
MSFPSHIKAVGIHKTGDFDVIENLTLPFPENAPGNVLMHYGGVNFIDTYFRKGLYKIDQFPYVLGTEGAGTVAALPSDPSVVNDEEFKKRGLKVGSKVAAYAGNVGTFAEYASIPWTKVFPVPESVSLQTAAGLFVQGLTALTFITESYNVQRGDYILVHTIAGGLGLQFAQLLKERGAIVIGTTSTKEKAELAKSYGADHVILYKDENVVERVLEITKGEGVHAVFDGVGKDTFEDNFKMLRRKGTLVSVGNASGAVPPFPPLKLVEKNLKLLRPTMGNYVYTAEEGRFYSSELFRFSSEGKLKVQVHKEYSLTSEGVQQAQKDLTGGQTVGKLLVKIADEE